MGVSPTIRQTSLRPDVDALVPTVPPGAAVLVQHHGTRPFPCVGRERAARGSAQAGSRPSAAQNVDLDEYLDRLSGETRILSTLFSVFALIGLLLSAVGIYAVTAYATSQRTQEIGIRIAMGAATRDVVWLVLGSGFEAARAGVADRNGPRDRREPASRKCPL